MSKEAKNVYSIEIVELVDSIILVPPRKGIAEESLLNISCNPSTFARDIEILEKEGYKLVRVKPVDMFPQTSHIETVYLLSELKSDHHIEEDLSIDEMDLTSAESKATYDEIKEYVLANNGFKVSIFYIIQVKDKVGIEKRQNYNISKKEDAKVRQCPADKEKAIMDALKHFKMID